MQRRAWTWGVAAAAAALGAGVSTWRWTLGAPAPDAEQTLWTLRWQRPDGGEVVAADYRGRPLLINFWATWCPPCIEELPLLERFWQQQRPRGWTVLGLAIDQPSAVRQFLQRQPLTFPIGLAGLGGTDLARQLGNARGGLPFTVVLDARGRVAQRKLGQVTADDLRQWAEAIGA
ncbi:TlpA family protein disulfide reductase [Tepidimonas charontis]|uniref:Thiol-disulfide oxidoreductase ResA n=1 Tax=Tepidimonas charontis TaxID=2267262 RepID=A0A554XF15_9BURK|nr:TlpA disulfide reductase family protein [Tepidimonas charontis]TSE34379.1 Thiol-disulfide oxidoreductase ResA [Tepidimonas charontis]